MSLRFAVTFSAVAAATVVSMAAVQPEARPEPPAAFTKVCVRCHASDKVVEGRGFPAQWDQVIEQLVAPMFGLGSA